MIQTPFTKVSAWAIDMQEDLHAPAHTALILQELLDLYDSVEKLKIDVDDENFMILTTSFIYANLNRCIPEKAIKNAIRFLDSIKVISYKTNYHKIYIKLNFKDLDRVRIKYDKDFSLKFYIVFHFIMKYVVSDTPKNTLLPLMCSLFIYEASEGKFAHEMSVDYIHKKFNSQFTQRQESYAKKKLIDIGILEEETKTYVSNGHFIKRCYYSIKIDKVNELLTKFNEELRDLYEADVVEKYQKCNFATRKVASTYSVKDKLKSDTYTKEEIEEFRRQADELEAAGGKAWF